MSDIEKIEQTMKRHPDPVVTVGDIVEAVEIDVSDTHVRQQMRALEAAEKVESKDIGARAVAWWHVERVTPAIVPPEDHPDQSDLDETVETVEQREPEQRPEEFALDLDLPGDGETLEERREAVRACLSYLREHGEATRSDFVDALYESHSAGYGSAGGWWNTIGKQGLRTVAERSQHVVAPGEGEHQWRISR